MRKILVKKFRVFTSDALFCKGKREFLDLQIFNQKIPKNYINIEPICSIINF